ncbi:hypothetical protein BS78_05G126800 [Paspalum vaginatum]|nr:hypothetical protein BS78_05G126800 [Paspalum vaginatum]
MDLLLKKLNDTPEAAPVQALDFHMTCEVCGNTGHPGISCPEMRPKDANFIGSNNFNNGNHPQPGWNSRPHLPFSGQGNSSGSSQQFPKSNYNFDQKAVNDSISKKFHANDRMFESISLQMETLNSAMKNQLSFNKMLETQIGWLLLYLTQMRVPTYAKYFKDILNNKKPLPSMEMVHLTEECSAAVLKKKDPGSPTISCSIGTQHFDQALCDLGASVSAMPKVIFDKLNHTALAPTAMCLQLADQSVRYPEGVAENIPVRIRNFLIPVYFMVLDMEIDSKTPTHPWAPIFEHR